MRRSALHLKAWQVTAALAASCLAPGWAAARLEFVAPNVVSARCRRDAHKLTTGIVESSLDQFAKCHRQRIDGDLPPVTNCNDVNAAPASLKVDRRSDLLTRRARGVCDERADVPPPPGLGCVMCPAPCASIPADDHRNPVGNSDGHTFADADLRPGARLRHLQHLCREFRWSRPVRRDLPVGGCIGQQRRRTRHLDRLAVDEHGRCP